MKIGYIAVLVFGSLSFWPCQGMKTRSGKINSALTAALNKVDVLDSQKNYDLLHPFVESIVKIGGTRGEQERVALVLYVRACKELGWFDRGIDVLTAIKSNQLGSIFADFIIQALAELRYMKNPEDPAVEQLLAEAVLFLSTAIKERIGSYISEVRTGKSTFDMSKGMGIYQATKDCLLAFLDFALTDANLAKISNWLDNGQFIGTQDKWFNSLLLNKNGDAIVVYLCAQLVAGFDILKKSNYPKIFLKSYLNLIESLLSGVTCRFQVLRKRYLEMQVIRRKMIVGEDCISLGSQFNNLFSELLLDLEAARNAGVGDAQEMYDATCSAYAHVLSLQGMFEDAERYYKLAIASADKVIRDEVIMNFAIYLFKNNKLNEAILALAPRVASADLNIVRDVDIVCLYVEYLIIDEQFELAIKCLTPVYQKYKTSPIISLFVSAYMGTSNNDMVDLLQKKHAISDKLIDEKRLHLSKRFEAAGKIERAIQVLEPIKILPNRFGIQIRARIGALYQKEAKFDLAETEYTQALEAYRALSQPKEELAGTVASVNHSLATIFKRRGDDEPDEALRKKAYRRAHDYARSAYRLEPFMPSKRILTLYVARLALLAKDTSILRQALALLKKTVEDELTDDSLMLTRLLIAYTEILLEVPVTVTIDIKDSQRYEEFEDAELKPVALFLIGRAFEASDHQKAIDYYQGAIDAVAADNPVHAVVEVALSKLMVEEAPTSSQSMSDLDAFEMHAYRAATLMGQNKFDETITESTNALVYFMQLDDPDESMRKKAAVVHHNLSEVYFARAGERLKKTGRLTDFYFNNEIAFALNHYRCALRLYSASEITDSLRLHVAHYLLCLGQLDKAVNELTMVLAGSPDPNIACVVHIMLLYCKWVLGVQNLQPDTQLGEFEAVEAELQPVYRATGWLARGDNHAQDNHEQAVIFYDQVISSPNLVDGHPLKQMALLKKAYVLWQSDSTQALAIINQLRVKYHGSITGRHAYLLALLIQESQGSKHEFRHFSRPLYDDLLQVISGNLFSECKFYAYRLIFKLGCASLKENRQEYDFAKDVLLNCLKQDNDPELRESVYEWLFKLAHWYSDNQDFQRALVCFEHVMQWRNSSDIQLQYAQALRDAGNQNKADAVLEHVANDCGCADAHRIDALKDLALRHPEGNKYILALAGFARSLL